MAVPLSRSQSILLTCVLFSFVSSNAPFAQLAGRENVEELPRFNVHPKPVTVSGFSAGGVMAIQLQVAFSRNVAGSAVFVATWYRCAPHGNDYFRDVCSPGRNNVQSGVNDAQRYAKEGKIDPLENLRNQTHFHYIANSDWLAHNRPLARAQTKTFFTDVGMERKNIQLVFKHSNHWMPTDNKSYIPCDSSVLSNVIIPDVNTTGLSYCHYYGAFEALQHLYNNTLTRPSDSVKLQPLRAFNQSRFMAPTDADFMDEVGYFYVPTKCREPSSSPCRFHVDLHGCRGSRSSVGNAYVVGSGYLEVAELNNIVMLFPQSIPFNDSHEGCFDIFGASNYTTYGKFSHAAVDLNGSVGNE